MLHGNVSRSEDKQHLAVFVDFLLGILDPDPWKRWTAFQAAQHPFLTGGRSRRRRPEAENNNNNTEVTATNNEIGVHWIPPWDPSICRRKLLTVQKTRERQQALRRGYGATRQPGYDGGDRVDMELYERMRRNSGSASFAGDGNGYVHITCCRLCARAGFCPISHSFVVYHSNMVGGRISPPSTPGYSQSGTSALHSALLGMSTDSERFSQGFSGPPQDMTEYSQYSGISSMALSYGDMSVPHPAMHVVHGPQTYSGLSYEGVNVHRVETEFGYALQRPGVVPSTHDLGGSYSSMGHRSVSSVGYSPHLNSHMPGPAQLQMGYVGTHASMPLMSSRRGSRNGYNMGHVPMSPMSQSYNLHHAPTSIREDCSDHQSEGGDGASTNSGVSLLAQQLEAREVVILVRELDLDRFCETLRVVRLLIDGDHRLGRRQGQHLLLHQAVVEQAQHALAQGRLDVRPALAPIGTSSSNGISFAWFYDPTDRAVYVCRAGSGGDTLECKAKAQLP